MHTFESILVPVDTSASARSALKLAHSLFEKASIQPVHVVRRLPAHVREVLFPYAPLGEDEAEFEQELLAASVAQLDAHLGDIPKDINDVIVELGLPQEVLPGQISRSAADLVVMGAFGESGIYSDAIGSLSDRTIKTARVPVLITRDYEANPTIKRILVATDLTRASAHVYSVALSLALSTGANLEALYVLPDPYELDTNNILRHTVKFDKRQALRKASDSISALFERVDELVGHLPFPDKDKLTKLMKRKNTRSGDPARELLKRAEELEADLIIVGSQRAQDGGRIRFGSVASTVVRRAPCHVMVVPVEPVPQLSEESN